MPKIPTTEIERVESSSVSLDDDFFTMPLPNNENQEKIRNDDIDAELDRYIWEISGVSRKCWENQSRVNVFEYW